MKITLGNAAFALYALIVAGIILGTSVSWYRNWPVKFVDSDGHCIGALESRRNGHEQVQQSCKWVEEKFFYHTKPAGS